MYFGLGLATALEAKPSTTADEVLRSIDCACATISIAGSPVFIYGSVRIQKVIDDDIPYLPTNADIFLMKYNSNMLVVLYGVLDKSLAISLDQEARHPYLPAQGISGSFGNTN
jgi:hypothetical protein